MADNEHEVRVVLESPSRRFANLYVTFERLRRDHHQKMVLRVADRRMLWLFTDRQPRTLKQISQELGLEQSTVNRQVNAAVTAGLLEKSRSSSGDTFHVESTALGRRTFEADVATSLADYDTALHTLGEADAAKLLELWERFVQAYENLGGSDDSTDEPR